MANRAHLLAVTDPHVTWPVNPRRAVLAEGINQVPLFWASLFVADDRQTDEYPADQKPLKVPNWCVKSGVARQRLRALRKPIRSLLANHPGRLWEQWVKFIDTVREPYVKTSAAEVWALDPRSYAKSWRTLLRAFTKPTPATMRAAVHAAGLTCDDDGRIDWEALEVDESLTRLAGAEYLRSLPWFGRYRAAFDEPVTAGRRTKYDDVFEAISPDLSLKEARKKAREILKRRPE